MDDPRVRLVGVAIRLDQSYMRPRSSQNRRPADPCDGAACDQQAERGVGGALAAADDSRDRLEGRSLKASAMIPQETHWAL
jgi:hypothetical protein